MRKTYGNYFSPIFYDLSYSKMKTGDESIDNDDRIITGEYMVMAMAMKMSMAMKISMGKE